MKNFDKEWRDWKSDMIGFLLVGLILGFCIGILTQSGGGIGQTHAWLGSIVK